MKNPLHKVLSLVLSAGLVASSADWGRVAAHAGVATAPVKVTRVGPTGLGTGAMNVSGPAATAYPLSSAQAALGSSLVLPASPMIRVRTGPAAALRGAAILSAPSSAGAEAAAVLRRSGTPAAAAAETSDHARDETTTEEKARPIDSQERTAASTESTSDPSPEADVDPGSAKKIEKTPVSRRSFAPSAVFKRVRAALRGVSRVKKGSDADARTAGETLEDALTGAKSSSGQDDVEAPEDSKSGSSRAKPALKPAASAEVSGREDSEPPAPKAADAPAKAGVRARLARWAGERLRVFRDPQRNKNFWRFFLGYEFMITGVQIGIVGLPYLVSSFTRNTLSPESQAAVSQQAFDALVRQRRGTVAGASRLSQVLAFLSLPFLMGKQKGGAKKLLTRAGWLRAAVLVLIPLHFFVFSGLMPAAISFGVLLTVFTLQNYFEGVHGGMISVMSSEVIGSSSVTKEERARANSLITGTAAVLSILVPALLGKLSAIPDILGKVGSGSASIFGIYSAVIAVSSLFFGMIALNRAKANPGGGAGMGARPMKAIKAGFKAIIGNRFFRTILLIDAFALLITDPLMFNVFPEFVKTILADSASTLSGLTQLPMIGWFLDGLINTPMGYFGLLVAAGSLGSALASMILNRVVDFLTKRGFLSEESQAVPLFRIGVVGAVAFAGIPLFPSIWPVLLFWMAHSFFRAFASIQRLSLYQKNMARYSPNERSAIIGGMSLTTAFVAFLSNMAYGFLFQHVTIAASMTVAIIAIGILGVMLWFAPNLMFSKDERARRKK